jgi:hypothetical protein
MTNHHRNRGRRRYGHLPGHIQDAFLEAVEAFEDWNPSGPLSPARVGYEIRHRPQQISVAEACGLVWGCTDILPGTVYRNPHGRPGNRFEAPKPTPRPRMRCSIT